MSISDTWARGQLLRSTTLVAKHVDYLHRNESVGKLDSSHTRLTYFHIHLSLKARRPYTDGQSRLVHERSHVFLLIRHSDVPPQTLAIHELNHISSTALLPTKAPQIQSGLKRQCAASSQAPYAIVRHIFHRSLYWHSRIIATIRGGWSI